MATADFYQAQNMFAPIAWYGVVARYSPNYVALANADPQAGFRKAEYFGNFSFTGTSLAGGVVTGFSEWFGTGDDFDVRDVALDALTVQRFLMSGDGVGFQAYVYGGDDAIAGSTGNDALRGLTGNDFLRGNAGNDLLQGGEGDDGLQGNDGVDTALYTWGRSSYELVLKDDSDDSGKITVSGGGEGYDTLNGIERVQFADVSVAFDLDGNAGQAYRIYQAAFDRTPDLGGLGDWIYAMDHGMSLVEVASGFISSPEFAARYGNSPSDAGFVTGLYGNVLHRAPEQAGYDYWMNQLAAGLQTRSEVLAGFSESPENQLQVVGVIEDGITYLQHAV